LSGAWTPMGVADTLLMERVHNFEEFGEFMTLSEA
jgi:hypothetical protein